MEQTYTAIETLGGFLAFTDTAEGRRKLRQFLQQTADAYFNPAFNSGALSVYRAEGELGNRPWVNPGRMWSDEYPYGPKPHGDQMELLYRGEMRPTAEDFRSFCHNAGCEISARNVNITDTLDALERYDRRVEELQRIPAKSARDREELLQTLETRRQLQKLMDSAYDVRGHRTAGENTGRPGGARHPGRSPALRTSQERTERGPRAVSAARKREQPLACLRVGGPSYGPDHLRRQPACGPENRQDQTGGREEAVQPARKNT